MRKLDKVSRIQWLLACCALCLLTLLAGCGAAGENNAKTSSALGEPRGGVSPASSDSMSRAVPVANTSPTMASTTRKAFKVTSIEVTVNPTSLKGKTCGTNMTVVYTATFTAPVDNAGGVVLFNYTLNNGRSQQDASLVFAPGETTKQYTFQWQGKLPSDHVYPGTGIVQVTSPNFMQSNAVKPDGACS